MDRMKITPTHLALNIVLSFGIFLAEFHPLWPEIPIQASIVLKTTRSFGLSRLPMSILGKR